jgi:uncharacterized protein YjgD (DUF1641 family)
MARPITLEIPPRDPAHELRVRLEAAPAKHGEALLAGYEVLQALHEQGVLDILRGAVSARDEIVEIAGTAADTPEAVRAIRNLLILTRLLGAMEPDRLREFVQPLSDGVAQATAKREPVGLWGLLRRFRSQDSLRAMAAGVDVLEAIGRHLRSLDNAPSS